MLPYGTRLPPELPLLPLALEELLPVLLVVVELLVPPPLPLLLLLLAATELPAPPPPELLALALLVLPAVKPPWSVGLLLHAAATPMRHRDAIRPRHPDSYALARPLLTEPPSPRTRAASVPRPRAQR
jgi:hypothetical protein